MRPAHLATTLALSLLALISAVAQPVANFAALAVRVTRAGQPVANAVVCIGTATDPNLFHQGTTDNQGNLSFSSVPPQSFVATANSGGRGIQQSYGIASPAGVPFMSITLSLPTATGGPACPSTTPGPQRTLVPRDLVLPNPQPIGFQPITLTKTEFCFGALGAQCGQPQTGIPATALCGNGVCFVNGGSWQHDECCFANPQGYACRNGPADTFTGHDGNCVAEWDKAVRLSSKGIFWQRNIDVTRRNTTGTVVFNEYCAPKNSLVPPADQNKCCSRDTRSLNAAEAVAATAANETLRACK